MQRRSVLGLVCAGVGMAGEISSGYYLLAMPAVMVWQALGLHLIAAIPLTAGIYLLLPAHYRHPRIGALAFIASCALIIPGLGALGMMLSLLPGLHANRQQKVLNWAALDSSELPFQPVPSVEPGDATLREGLASVLLHSLDSQQRQQAIMACRHLPRRHVVPLLQRALTDVSDEVRLLAYAMLNTIEHSLDSRIQALQSREEAGEDYSGNRCEALSRLYWEYCYLQLVQGSVAAFFLEQALAYTDEAIVRKATAQRWLLRGRILSEQGLYTDAQQAFDESERLGMHDDDLVPQRAELAFRRRRFQEVSDQLQRLSSRAAEQPALRPLGEYWR